MDSLVSNFRWSEAPMNSIYWPLGVGLFYIMTCLGHRLAYGNSPSETVAWKYIKPFLPYHNIFLSLISAVMFFGCGFAAIQKTSEEGSLHWIFCEAGEADTGVLSFWCYIYYLSKYYELLDTWLQLLRGKYPPHYLLHAYHHSVVLIMCWLWLEYRVSLRFVALLFNVFVHIVMYYYFYLKCIKKDPWWKKYVTTLQIVQFMFSFISCAITIYFSAFQGDNCNGMVWLYAQIVFNATLLSGFVGVLKKTVSKEKKK